MFNSDSVTVKRLPSRIGLNHMSVILQEVVSFHHAKQLRQYLERQEHIGRVGGYYVPDSQTLHLFCFVHTTLSVDASGLISGYMGPGALRFAPQEIVQ